MRPNGMIGSIAYQAVRRLSYTLVLTPLFFKATTLVAQEQASPSSISQIAAAASSEPIASGDLLYIDVFNTPELSGRFRVNLDGTVLLLQGGLVNVNGLTPLQAGQQIERRLREGQIMLDPHVTVSVQEYAAPGVTVVGQVRTPGSYPLLGEHTLVEVLAAAGGPTETQGSTITVTHRGKPSRSEVVSVSAPNYPELLQTTQVYPGDTVVVSQSELIYVYGSVGHPGAYPFRPGDSLNVLEVLSLAQGVENYADQAKASIIRRTPTGVQRIPLDLKGMYRRGEVGPTLQASDILVIPRSGTRTVLFSVLPTATGALVAALIYSLTR